MDRALEKYLQLFWAMTDKIHCDPIKNAEKKLL